MELLGQKANEIQENAKAMVLRGALITQTSVRQLMQPGTCTSLKVVLSYSDDKIIVQKS